MYQSTVLNGPKKVNAAFKKKRSSGGRLGMRSSLSRKGRATTKSIVVSETRNPFSRRSVNVPSAIELRSATAHPSRKKCIWQIETPLYLLDSTLANPTEI